MRGREQEGWKWSQAQWPTLKPRALRLGPSGHCSTLCSTAANIPRGNLVRQEKANGVYSALRSTLFPLPACPCSGLRGGGGPPAHRERHHPRCPRQRASTLSSWSTPPWMRGARRLRPDQRPARCGTRNAEGARRRVWDRGHRTEDEGIHPRTDERSRFGETSEFFTGLLLSLLTLPKA